MRASWLSSILNPGQKPLQVHLMVGSWDIKSCKHNKWPGCHWDLLEKKVEGAEGAQAVTLVVLKECWVTSHGQLLLCMVAGAGWA